MGEVGRAVAGRNLGEQTAVTEDFSLEFVDIQVGGNLIHDEVVHIEQGGCQILGSCEALAVLAGLVELVHQFLRNHLTCLIVLCIYFKHLRLKCPVLVDLRGELHEIAGHRGVALIPYILKEGLEGMSELVEECLGLIGAQQCGSVICSAGKVAHDGHDRDNPYTVLVVLLAVASAPCTASLVAGTGEHIHEDDAEGGAVSVLALECLSLGMGHGYVVQLGKGNAVQTVSHIENTLTHVLELEVGLQLVLGEVELLGLGLLEVVSPVSGCQLTVDAMGLGDGIHVGKLTPGGLQRGSPELVEEIVYSLGGLGHAVLENELGIVVIAHDLGLLVIEVHHLYNDSLVVILIAVVAAVKVAVKQLGTQISIVIKLEERHYTGVIQAKGPPSAHTFFFRTLCCCINSRFGKSCQVGFILHYQGKISRLLKHILLELKLKLRYT